MRNKNLFIVVPWIVCTCSVLLFLLLGWDPWNRPRGFQIVDWIMFLAFVSLVVATVFNLWSTSWLHRKEDKEKSIGRKSSE